MRSSAILRAAAAVAVLAAATPAFAGLASRMKAEQAGAAGQQPAGNAAPGPSAPPSAPPHPQGNQPPLGATAQPPYGSYYGAPPPAAAYGAPPHAAAGVQSHGHTGYGVASEYGSTAPPSYEEGSSYFGAAPKPGHQGVSFNQAAQQQYAPQPSDSGSLADVLRSKLNQIIEAKSLQHFYRRDGGAKLEQVVQKLVAVDWNSLQANYRVTKDILYDLAALALYDIAIFIDDSGSIVWNNRRGDDRQGDIKAFLENIAVIGSQFDDDGIVVRFMNSDDREHNPKTAEEASRLIDNHRFGGMTPIGTKFDEKVLQPYFYGQSQMSKPLLAFIIFDGAPSEGNGETRSSLRDAIARAKAHGARLYGPGALAVEIAVVGTDQGAQAHLDSLDEDSVIGDVVDCTSCFEIEEAQWARRQVRMSPSMYLMKLMVGAINPEYDAHDEQG